MLRPVTTQLSDVDRVEIEAIFGQETIIDQVVSSKILVGTDTQQIVTLWRSQKYFYGPGALCHSPAYRIRFFKNGALITEATICFHCYNIYFYKYAGAKNPEAPSEVAFDVTSEAGKKLRAYLGNLFPGHDPDANKP